MKYYTPTNIIKKNAVYNIIFGERSNGKTYALLRHGLQQWAKDRSQMAYIRRWKEDITGRRASTLFAGLMANDEIKKITGGRFKGIHYFAGKYYACNYDDSDKPIYSDLDVVCFGFALTNVEHDKSTSYPDIKTIIFDEFLTSKAYLADEFVSFMNVVSTIVRRREDVKIYMLGNTVNKYSPYFGEMGLKNIERMEAGTIDLYSYGDSGLTVAVEYCPSMNDPSSTKNKYFAFDNPKLRMITSGAWELNMFPHLPMKYKPKDILLIYFIEFNENIFQCEIIQVGDVCFTYIHAKTTPIKNPENHYIYTMENHHEINYNKSVLNPMNKTQEKIAWFFRNNRVFYQDNNIGDAINNYLKVSG